MQTKIVSALGAGSLHRQAINQRHVSLSIYKATWQDRQRTIFRQCFPCPENTAQGLLPRFCRGKYSRLFTLMPYAAHAPPWGEEWGQLPAVG